MSNQWLERVKKIASERGISLEAVAKSAGRDRSYFKTAEKDGSKPKLETALAIASALSVDFESVFGTLYSGVAPRSRSEKKGDSDFLRVPEIDVRGGAGGGGVVIEDYDHTSGEWAPKDAIRDNWGLPAAFLRHEARIRSGSANIIEISGDSMVDPSHPNATGTLMPGDRAILDTSDTTPSPPGSFAVWDGIGVVVKMVEVVHGSDPVRLRLSSRNPAYQTYEILMDEARIIGRVRGRITVY